MRDSFHPSSRSGDSGETARRRTLGDVSPTGRHRAPRVMLDATPPYGTPLRRPAVEDSGEDWRGRERTAARPLVRAPMPRRTIEFAAIEEQTYSPRADLVPDLAAYSQKLPARRPRLNTRTLARRARSPWSLSRMLLAALALIAAFWTGMAHAGEPSQPLMGDSWRTVAGAHVAQNISNLVQPETQGTRPDLYDSYTQFNDWWDAACSAAVTSEVLTAWSAPRATIGHLIDAMQPDISLDGGLLTPHGFIRGATAFGYRADISWHLSYKQLEYITNTLGLPVIVNVRIS
ncbi:MAG: hypothetical protein ACRDHP_14280, partial [Ktedonobacterales bacterium]